MAIFKKQGVYWIDYYVSGRRKRERIGPESRLGERYQVGCNLVTGHANHRRRAGIASTPRMFHPRREDRWRHYNPKSYWICCLREIL